MGQASRKILTMERDWTVPAPLAAARKGSAEAVRRSPLRLVPRDEHVDAPLPEVTAAVVEGSALSLANRSWAIEGVYAMLAIGSALTLWWSTG